MSVVPRKPASSVAPGGSVPPAGARAQEDLLLLTRDQNLIDALASAVPMGQLSVIADEAELVSQLMSGNAGVVFLDESMTHGRPGVTAQLLQRLREQFPGIVMVVTGDGAAQNELAALVADGTIYRFVHKPVSPQRVKLFVDAAFRKREGSASGVYPALSVSQTVPVLTPPAAQRPLPWMWILGGAALVVAIAAAWALRSMVQSNANAARRVASAVVAQPPRALPAPKVAPAVTSTPAAVAKPPDLDLLATGAEQALLAGNLAEASRLTDAARAIDPNHVRVKFLTAQIAREHTAANERRRAALEAAAAPPPRATPVVPPAPAQATAPPTVTQAPTPAPSPVTTTTAVTLSAPSLASTPESPTSAPPSSEAKNKNSVAAVVLERVYAVNPDFPESARQHDLSGYVDLEFTVRADGTVTDVTVIKAMPVGVFERSAVAAVRQWRYRPFSRNGAPVSQPARIRLNFAYK